MYVTSNTFFVYGNGYLLCFKNKANIFPTANHFTRCEDFLFIFIYIIIIIIIIIFFWISANEYSILYFYPVSAGDMYM